MPEQGDVKAAREYRHINIGKDIHWYNWNDENVAAYATSQTAELREELTRIQTIAHDTAREGEGKDDQIIALRTEAERLQAQLAQMRELARGVLTNSADPELRQWAYLLLNSTPSSSEWLAQHDREAGAKALREAADYCNKQAEIYRAVGDAKMFALWARRGKWLRADALAGEKLPTPPEG